MAQHFGQVRNVELSTIQYVEAQLAISWSSVTVVKGFPKNNKGNLPIVAVRMGPNNATRREIGSTSMLNTYNILIDIFATSSGQRLDLSQTIETMLLGNWTYNVYSNPSGGGETLDKADSGRVSFREFTQNEPVEFLEDVSSFDRFRHIIGVSVTVGPT